MTLGTILTFLTSDVGQSLVVGAASFLWAHRWWRSKHDARAQWIAGKAREAFLAVKQEGDRKGWDSPTKWRHFQELMGKALLAEGMKALSGAELGMLGLLTQRMHWATPAKEPAPLPFASVR